MAKDSSISIRIDSQLKEQVEVVLSSLGLNVATVVNMLFHQIVREQEVPLSLSLNKSQSDVLGELNAAKAERFSGYRGRNARQVASEMEQILSEDG